MTKSPPPLPPKKKQYPQENQTHVNPAPRKIKHAHTHSPILYIFYITVQREEESRGPADGEGRDTRRESAAAAKLQHGNTRQATAHRKRPELRADLNMHGGY